VSYRISARYLMIKKMEETEMHDFSDWNDLLCIQGSKVARQVLIQTIKEQLLDLNQEK
jgi:hypothetical protein